MDNAELYKKENYNNNYLFKIKDDKLCIVPVNGKNYRIKEKLVKRKDHKEKYLLLLLTDNNGIIRQINYSKFIIENFIPKNKYSSSKYEHIDGNVLNAKISNLRWIDNPYLIKKESKLEYEHTAITDTDKFIKIILKNMLNLQTEFKNIDLTITTNKEIIKFNINEIK